MTDIRNADLRIEVAQQSIAKHGKSKIDPFATWGELEATLRPREAELRRALAERIRAELADEA